MVVTEDTVTRGTSLLEAAHAVIEAGAVPVLLVAVVDRGGTVEAMAAAEGLPFRALVTAPDLGFDYEGGSVDGQPGVVSPRRLPAVRPRPGRNQRPWSVPPPSASTR